MLTGEVWAYNLMDPPICSASLCVELMQLHGARITLNDMSGEREVLYMCSARRNVYRAFHRYHLCTDCSGTNHIACMFMFNTPAFALNAINESVSVRWARNCRIYTVCQLKTMLSCNYAAKWQSHSYSITRLTFGTAIPLMSAITLQLWANIN